MAEDFLKNLIKEYKHWSIYAHHNQLSRVLRYMAQTRGRS